MAGNEGTSQTELFTGWSSVVHQPCEDPEESELPSTVDMAAFSSGLNVEPAGTSQTHDASGDSDSDSDVDSSISGSEASASCSQSDSSDSDTSTSSQESSSRSPSPEFSVTSSTQTNGLRLTIATVKKSSASPTHDKAAGKAADARLKGPGAVNCSSNSSDSVCTSDSDDSGGSETSHKSKVSGNHSNNKAASNVKCAKENVVVKKVVVTKARTTRSQDKKCAKKESVNNSTSKSSNTRLKTRQKQVKKMASLPISRGSTYSSSDSDDSDTDSAMLASCSLQEIREEDLAAILPDQQECDAFGDFECNRTDKNSPQAGDMSGSDMELPQQAVNALIQRTTESSSECESHAPPNPNTLYANSLLQQFVAQTQMLNAPCPVSQQSTNNNASSNSNTNQTTSVNIDLKKNNAIEVDVVKRKRGRPRKNVNHKRLVEVKKTHQVKCLSTAEYCGDPNVSPDSGIQNSPDHVSSPEPSLSPNVKNNNKHNNVVVTKEESKKNLIVVDGTSTSKRSSHVAAADAKCNNNNNNKLPKATSNQSKELTKLSVTSNRFDRILYGNTERVLYPPRRKVGRPPIIKKGPGRPPKHKPVPAAAPASVNNNELAATIITTTDKNVDKLKTGIKTKQETTQQQSPLLRPVLTSKNKVVDNVLKAKYQTLNNLKVMHSKHKHRKHKKYKFKILKPVTDTILNDPKINAEIEKLVADFMKFCVIGIATKPPKENIPDVLIKTIKKVSKKRKTLEHAERKKKKQNVNATVNAKVTNVNEQRLPLKKRHYLFSDGKSQVKQIKTEVVEEVETLSGSPDPEKDVNSTNSSSITTTAAAATTPKKRHRLEMVSSKEKENSTNINSVLPQLTVVTATTGSGTGSSTSSSPETQKIKPKVSLESLISELKMKRSLSGRNVTTTSIAALNNNTNNTNENSKKSEVQKIELSSSQPIVKMVQCTNQEIVKLTTTTLDTSSTKKKIRKRRAINRTGFPTIKKKKKKIIIVKEPLPSPPSLSLISAAVSLNNDEIDVKPVIDIVCCDRVPKDGEEYNKFIQRTEKPDCSIETTTTKSPKIEDAMSSKWEVMSECDSLPQDERTEIERSESGDLEEISLEASIERLRSRLEKKKRKRCSEKVCDNLNGYPKRRLRDISPASSIEQFNERRLREDRASASSDEAKKNKKTPRWRKKFLIAGLFSDYYKEDDETARIRRNENAAKSRFVYNPSEHPYGLLPPPYHCGKYLRCRKVPFQLPHDLWWQHTHSQLPGRDLVPSWNYRKIRTNIYNVKTTTGACEPQPCNCTSSSSCGDDCINRLVLAECPASHRCQNQRIQRHEWSPGIDKFMTESKGWGVQTKLPIKNGEFILEYVGEVVSDQEFKERMATIYVNDTHHYCLHLDGGLVIDGHRMGGDGRFVNHSCQPNCEMQKWSVNGQFRMALFSLRDIEGGEELTYDYNFSLFNPAEGQECKCGSDMCRGVIGGKSQRVRQLPSSMMDGSNGNSKNLTSGGAGGGGGNGGGGGGGRVGRPRKNQAKKASSTGLVKVDPPPPIISIIPPPQLIKPMSHQQKCFILERHCFLLRNLTKVRKVRERSSSSMSVSRQQTVSPVNHGATFINHLNALEKPRNMRTRRLAQAEDDPELNKTVKLAAVLRDIWNVVTKAKDENGVLLSALFMTMPSKRKVPEYYQRITKPIDLSTIEQNIATGLYRTAESFNADMIRLFANYIRFYGRTNELGVAATRLKKIYSEARQLSLPKFESALGKKPPLNFVSNKSKNEEEDIIRCICGMHHDEGLMIQCERCLVWQHCECVKADVSAPSYHCELCVHREVEYEISLDEFTEHGHRYYMTLLRSKLQLRQGDTVYVLRDIPIPGSDQKHTYITIGKIDYKDLDIFRIERLWKDSKTGQRFAYGHHYLRPHETYHEPSRKFFPNEVMRVPLYEAVPVELIISHCWVMDLNTFCKGRPIGAPEDHVYICEYRVDKNARLFSKVSKSKYPICTKSFAFERFDTRLKVSRTYTPHDLDPAMVKPRGRKPHENDEPRDIVASVSASAAVVIPVHVPVVRTPAEQKARLNKILLNLLGKMPNKQVLDVSYLLEGGRRRKKPVESVSNKS